MKYLSSKVYITRHNNKGKSCPSIVSLLQFQHVDRPGINSLNCLHAHYQELQKPSADMDDKEVDLIDFLRDRDVEESSLRRIEEEKVDCSALLEMNDDR